jgi:two-component system, cell cycle sensor histidine kinase and response regulator CckA
MSGISTATLLRYAPPYPGRSEASSRRGTSRILPVEDEHGVLTFVTAALRQHGYRITSADCGEKARALFHGSPDAFDLVMSDVVLPDASGVDLVEEFFLARPGLKALLTSGYSEKAALVELVRKRGLFFLHKPYTLGRLLECVHQSLSTSSSVLVG